MNIANFKTEARVSTKPLNSFEKEKIMKKTSLLVLLFAGITLAPLALGLGSESLYAQEATEAPAAVETNKISAEMFTVNNVWMMVATFLVFIMHLGFASLESGLCQAKNTVNILFKNTMIVTIGLLTYALI